MTNDDDSLPNSGKTTDQQLGFDQDAFVAPREQETRREPGFGSFEDDEYEEPDRDTDYASNYVEEEPEEDFEPYDDDAENCIDDELEDESEPADEVDSWPIPERRPEDSWDDSLSTAPDTQDEELFEDDNAEDQQEWQEEYEEQAAAWPLGLIAVAILAIVLLAAGGYGVMQQRSATQGEIRELQAQLATAVRPAEVSATRDSQLELKQRNVELTMQLDSLRLENRRLSDTVKGLESQLDAQQKALARPKPAPPKTPTVKPKPAPVSAPAKPAAAATGNWFVNFGSYSQRPAAADWAAKLKPSSGRAVVTTGSKDGKTFYRVRVIGLGSRESAQKLAGQLESQYGLSKLWVGQQ